VHAVGDSVVLQVSLPRQPCFKLNHRFELKNFAPNTWKQSRTGWYYRVLKEGSVRAGDKVRLVERPWPQWTVERVQEYLHRCTDNAAMNEELAGLKELGEESRGEFRRRVAKRKLMEKRALLGEDATREVWRNFRIVEKNAETARIVSLRLEALVPDPEAERLSAGTHARIKLPSGLTRSYSVVSGDRNAFELGIALEQNSRGASKFFHGEAKPGDVVQVGKMTTDVQFEGAKSNHVFIVGGIGITAFLSLIRGYHSINYNYQLHYAVRSADDVPFAERLEPFGKNMTLYDGAKGQRMDIESILKSLSWNSHVYVCGPKRMMDAAREAAEECGLEEKDVHYEAFEANTAGEPYEVEVANHGGKLVQVGADETLLEVLKREFDDVPSSCEVGNCGTCKINLKKGNVDHRGSALSQEEKVTSMLSCVSRGLGRIVVEI
jgi:ferredoxin-NADP reductase